MNDQTKQAPAPKTEPPKQVAPKEAPRKPRIVAMIEFQSTLFVATETTVYMKKGGLLTPATWQVPG